MDLGYDYMPEEQGRDDENDRKEPSQEQAGATANNLNAEFQEAYQAVSNSPWGMRLGGWVATAKKQVGFQVP